MPCPTSTFVVKAKKYLSGFLQLKTFLNIQVAIILSKSKENVYYLNCGIFDIEMTGYSTKVSRRKSFCWFIEADHVSFIKMASSIKYQLLTVKIQVGIFLNSTRKFLTKNLKIITST